MEEVSGRYQILNEIGAGGMGVVYRARDKNFQRDVALKLLPRHLTKDESFLDRFQREAQVVGRLEHPHIIPVYDVGMYDEQPFLVMRFLKGGTLRDQMKTSDFDLQALLKAMAQVASALDVAHKRRIIHRDLKPSNILFDEIRTAFLSDFGIAKVLDAATQLTGTGMVGTPTYMSPEQFTGQTEVTGRSDQYALAVVIFEALAGRLPFEGNTTAQVMFQHISQPPPDLHVLATKYPPEMSAVLRRALAKDPEDRYPTVSEMVGALQIVANRFPPGAMLPSAEQTVVDSPRPFPTPEDIARGAAAAGMAYAAGTAAGPPADYQQQAPAQPHAEATRAAKTGVRAPARPVTPAPESTRVAGKPSERKFPIVPVLVGFGVVIFFLLVLGGVGYGAYAFLSGGDETPTTTPTTVAEAPEDQDAGAVFPVGASGTVRVAGSSAQYRPPGAAEFIPLAAGEKVPLEQGTVIRAGSQPLALVLPDDAELSLDADTEIEFEMVATEDRPEETSLIINDGRLLLSRTAAEGATVLLRSPAGAVFTVNEGSAGVVYRRIGQIFQASCFASSCLLSSGGDTIPLATNEGAEVAGGDPPGSTFVAVAGDFCDLAPENEACVTPTPTSTATPTATSTGEGATATPSETPEPAATATATAIPATNTPLPTNTAIPATNTSIPPTNTPFVPTNTPLPPPTNTPVPPPTQPPPTSPPPAPTYTAEPP
jgi:serine/threonine-protein kinase